MKKLLLLLPIIALLATSCNKEQERTYLFYWDYSTSNRLLDDDITSLSFYVNSEFIGTESAYTYWNGEPQCGSTGAIEKSFTYTKKNDYESSSIYYVVKDQYGFILANDVLVNDSDCFITKLYY